VRAFFAVGFGSLTFDPHTNTPPARVELAVLRVEVDGQVVLNASIQELFMGRPWDASSSFNSLPQQQRDSSPPPLEGSSGEWLYPAFPSSHNFALERGAQGTLHSGWLMQTPICANHRLRLSLSYPGIQHLYWSPNDLIQASSWCTSTYEKCPVAQYFNVAALRFTGTTLPKGWTPFSLSSTHTPLNPQALASVNLPASPRGIWSAERVLREAREASLGGVREGVGLLVPGGPPVSIFSQARGGGPGVVTSLTLRFPIAPHLLHSRAIRVLAIWDEGGGAREDARAAAAAQGGGSAAPAGGREPFTSPGWSDGEELGGDTPPPFQPRQGGGVLEFDLFSILGPARMGEDGPRADPSATPVNCRKELYLVGETPSSEFYLTLPMPFWHSARILVYYDGEGGGDDGEGDGSDQGAKEEQRKSPVEVQFTVTLSPDPHFYVEGTAGYLQGGVRRFSMEEGARGNVMAEETGVRGALALVAAYVVGETQQFVEGDLRLWVDGSPTPSIWESGWEDFFNGSHGYDEDLHHCGEGLFSYDRVDPLWWGWYNNSHQRIHFWQARLLLGDALTWHSGFRMAVEGLPIKYAGRVEALTLWYGYPTSAPLHTSDWVHPPAEWNPPHSLVILAGGGGAEEERDALLGRGRFLPPPAHHRQHGYAIVVPTLEFLSTPYTLRSGLPSYGEWEKIALLKCFKKKQCTHEGAGGGVAVTVEGALALWSGATVAFTVRIDPTADFVFLRRLVDIRYSVQRAAVSVDGVACGTWSSSDRDYLHLLTSWKVETHTLPREVTRGKSSIRVVLRVLGEEEKGGKERAERVFPDFTNLGAGWTEARWEVVNVPPL